MCEKCAFYQQVREEEFPDFMLAPNLLARLTGQTGQDPELRQS